MQGWKLLRGAELQEKEDQSIQEICLERTYSEKISVNSKT